MPRSRYHRSNSRYIDFTTTVASDPTRIKSWKRTIGLFKSKKSGEKGISLVGYHVSPCAKHAMNKFSPSGGGPLECPGLSSLYRHHLV